MKLRLVVDLNINDELMDNEKFVSSGVIKEIMNGNINIHCAVAKLLDENDEVCDEIDIAQAVLDNLKEEA